MIFPTTYNRILVKTISVLFIVLFVYAATSKLLDYETFTVQLSQSPLLSAYVSIIAWAVPGMEIIIAILLMTPRFRTVAFYAAFLLMVMFTAYIFIVLNFSDFIPCSCGGVLEKLSWSQHFIFNLVFILLAAFAILIGQKKLLKGKLLLLTLIVIFGIGIVAVLYAFSEKKIHRNNAFQRRYIPHPIDKIGEFHLDYNTYYLAGIDDSIVYLGNFGAPLFLKELNISLKEEKKIPIRISNYRLPYRRVRISVEPPFFYLGDGTVPIIFRGNTIDWNAKPLYDNKVYFSQFVVIDSVNIGILTMSTATNSKALGLIQKIDDKDSLILNTSLLKNERSSSFIADGLLLWNDSHQKFIYPYYYRNSFEVMDKHFKYEYSGTSIDTIRQPVLDVVYSNKDNQYSLGGKSITVNRLSATSDNYLFINSDRLGQYENEKILKSASIIDVYDIVKNIYSFSFYLYHPPDKKLIEFQIHKGLLVAIVDDNLLLYKLKPEVF